MLVHFVVMRRNERMKRSALIAVVALVAAACSQGGGGAATSRIESKSGTQVTGTATFTEKDGKVDVVLNVKALPPGKHGAYLHEKGDCTGSNAAAVGKRFMPGGAERGGVLGEIVSTGDGSSTLTVTSDAFTVSAGEKSIIGRSVVISGDPDNPALHETFGIIGCGVIEPATGS
jgi:Cu-Zn family superoxide dismutase